MNQCVPSTVLSEFLVLCELFGRSNGLTDVSCDNWWERVSAFQDDEVGEVERCAVLAHLDDCEQCRTRLAASVEVAQMVARTAPGEVAKVSLGDLRSVERHWLVARGGRGALVAVGLAIVGFAVPEYFQGDTADSAAHVARHLATWQFGFGVGLIVAAIQSRFSQALLALAMSVAVLTVVTSIVDVALGHRAPFAEGVHAVELAGIGLLWWMTPAHLRPRRRTPRTVGVPGGGLRLVDGRIGAGQDDT